MPTVRPDPSIISRSAAELLFPGEDPLDQQLRPAGTDDDTWSTVIGVVEDALLDDFRRASPEPMVYCGGRYEVDPRRPARPALSAIIREIIPESPMYGIFTMEQLAANGLIAISFIMLMIGMWRLGR